jgi:ABC-2 type transport system permease protein
MTSTATPTLDSGPNGPQPPPERSAPVAVRSRRDDLAAFPAVLTSEWIKLSTVRSTRAITVLTGAIGIVATWATAALVEDEVLVVADVFVYSTFLTAVIAAIASILLFTSEAQHGTLATALTAQPARWLLVAAKTVTALGTGLRLGVLGMVTGFAGGLLGGLELGDTSGMAATAGWALTFTALASVLGLGVGMVVKHSAAAISGLLVWWLVVENLLWAFLPATISRFLPFYAGGAVLGVEVDTATPETLAVALTRTQDALVFGAFAALALVAGTVLLHRRDTN